jgi:hypothetical protein
VYSIAEVIEGVLPGSAVDLDDLAGNAGEVALCRRCRRRVVGCVTDVTEKARGRSARGVPADGVVAESPGRTVDVYEFAESETCRILVSDHEVIGARSLMKRDNGP